MKVDDFFEALGDIDENKITQAAHIEKRTVKPTFIKWASLAACISVVAAVGINMQHKPLKTAPKENYETRISEDNAEIKTEDKIAEDKEKSNIKKDEIQVNREKENKKTSGEKSEGAERVETEQASPVEESEKKALEDCADNDALKVPDLTADTTQTQIAEKEEELIEDASLLQGASGGGSTAAPWPAQYKITKEDSESLAKRIFGGLYNDENGSAVVILTEDTPENRAAVCNAEGLDESSVIFKQGTFNLEYLESLKNDILTFAQEEEEIVASAAVLVSENCVEVTVNTSDEEKLLIIKDFDGVGGAIKFRPAMDGGIE